VYVIPEGMAIAGDDLSVVSMSSGGTMVSAAGPAGIPAGQVTTVTPLLRLGILQR
jgi:hypothetical protein